jgi:hypothetical protein
MSANKSVFRRPPPIRSPKCTPQSLRPRTAPTGSEECKATLMARRCSVDRVKGWAMSGERVKSAPHATNVNVWQGSRSRLRVKDRPGARCELSSRAANQSDKTSSTIAAYANGHGLAEFEIDVSAESTKPVDIVVLRSDRTEEHLSLQPVSSGRTSLDLGAPAPKGAPPGSKWIEGLYFAPRVIPRAARRRRSRSAACGRIDTCPRASGCSTPRWTAGPRRGRRRTSDTTRAAASVEPRPS